jgi:hypothetical protein
MSLHSTAKKLQRVYMLVSQIGKFYLRTESQNIASGYVIFIEAFIGYCPILP